MSPEEIIELVSLGYHKNSDYPDFLNFVDKLISVQAVDFKKPVYKQVFKEFAPHLE